jgi:hypothetical protein
MENQQSQTFGVGDMVLAKGGERGTVQAIEQEAADAALTLYRVQFHGCALGLISIRGAMLEPYHGPEGA